MTNEKMQEFTNNLTKKLGEENASLIADDIGLLITDNANMNTEIENHKSEIENLKTDKENLIKTNGNLLQQVAMGVVETKTKEEQPKKFNYNDCFDEKGNFKR